MAVTVHCGVEEISLSALVGKTVGYIRGRMADDMGIKDSMAARLNGDTVTDELNTVVDDDDVLEFVKEAGNKGN